MKVKIVVNNVEDYEAIFKIFQSANVDVSENPTHIFFEIGSEMTHPNFVKLTSGETVFIHFSEIVLIESFENIIELHSEHMMYETFTRLHEFEKLTSIYDFIRINKSQIINTNKITRIIPQLNSKLKIYMCDMSIVFVSRTYIKAFREKIRHLGGQ